jgi:hypothetical protein
LFKYRQRSLCLYSFDSSITVTQSYRRLFGRQILALFLRPDLYSSLLFTQTSEQLHFPFDFLFVLFVFEPELLDVLLKSLEVIFEIVLVVLPFVYIVPDQTLYFLLEFL